MAWLEILQGKKEVFGGYEKIGLARAKSSRQNKPCEPGLTVRQLPHSDAWR